MHGNTCARYTALARQRDAIDKELDALKGIIFEDMSSDGLGTYDYKGSKFTIMKRAKWVYTEAIVALEEMLSQAREDERDRGTARVEEVETLRVQIN